MREDNNRHTERGEKFKVVMKKFREIQLSHKAKQDLLQEKLTKAEEETSKKEEELKQKTNDSDKYRELCLSYERQIETLESKVENLEAAAKVKVRLAHEDAASTSQPTLAVSGQQRSDKGVTDRPSANIKPMQPQRSHTAFRPQAAVVHVQPMQSLQSTEAVSADQSAASSATSPNVFSAVATVPQSARVVPQVRTVGEISSVPTPPHAQEFSVYTGAASSTTLDSGVNVDAAAAAASSSTGVAENNVTASATAAIVMPIARPTISLPTSSSDRTDTTAAVHPFNVHSASATVTPPTFFVPPSDSQQQQQEISSTHQALTSSSAIPLIVPFSGNTLPSSSSSNRGEVGPADSSYSAKRARESFAADDEEEASGSSTTGKRARVAANLATVAAAPSSNISNAEILQSTTADDSNESNGAAVVCEASSNFAEQVLPISVSELPDIPSVVFDAIAAISSSAGDSHVISESTSTATSDECLREAEAGSSRFYEVSGDHLESIEESNVVTSVSASHSGVNFEGIDCGSVELNLEESETTEVGEEATEVDDEGANDDLQETAEDEDEDDEEDDVICLSDGDNDEEPNFSQIEPEVALIHSVADVRSAQDIQDEDLDQDEINAYDEEPIHSASAVEIMPATDFSTENSVEGDVGIIVSSHQASSFVSGYQVETYSIEAMDASSATDSNVSGPPNNDNPVWMLGASSSLDPADNSSPQSPSVDPNEAAVTSSGAVVDVDGSEQPQLRSLQSVARKTVMRSRPRLRRNQSLQQQANDGSENP